MTDAARHTAAHEIGSPVPVPVLRTVELAFDQAPGLAELAERADAHEVLHLVREAAPVLVAMTAEDFEQALDDAAALAEARAVLDEIERNPDSLLSVEQTTAFLEGIAARTAGA
jgi:hypothetical protein